MLSLKERRKGQQLTQQKTAELCGISASSYCNIENGQRRPSVKVAKRIGKVLAFDWTLLFQENEE